MKSFSSIQKANFMLYDKLITYFRFGYIIISIIAVITLDESRRFEINSFTICLLVGLIFSHLMLFSPKLRKMLTYTYPYITCILDIAWISVGVGLSGGIISDFHLIYLLIIVFCALVYSFRNTMVVGALCSAAYSVTIVISGGFINHFIIVRSAFFIAFAYFSGYLCKTIAEYQIKLATKDGLTSLNNRQFFYNEINHILLEKREIEKATFVFFDVDNFKEINDKKGHPAGDNILKVLSKIIEQNIRRGDLAARYGGDEFVLVLQETDKTGARTVIDRIQRELDKQFLGTVTIFVGYALYPEQAEDLDELIKIADIDMYNAKIAKKKDKTEIGA